jgi:hypothetical protein
MEKPSILRRESCDLRLTPLVVHSSDSRCATAPHRPQMPDQTSRPDRTDAVRPLAPPKDEIVGCGLTNCSSTSLTSLTAPSTLRRTRPPTLSCTQSGGL